MANHPATWDVSCYWEAYSILGQFDANCQKKISEMWNQCGQLGNESVDPARDLTSRFATALAQAAAARKERKGDPAAKKIVKEWCKDHVEPLLTDWLMSKKAGREKDNYEIELKRVIRSVQADCEFTEEEKAKNRLSLGEKTS